MQPGILGGQFPVPPAVRPSADDAAFAGVFLLLQ